MRSKEAREVFHIRTDRSGGSLDYTIHVTFFKMKVWLGDYPNRSLQHLWNELSADFSLSELDLHNCNLVTNNQKVRISGKKLDQVISAVCLNKLIVLLMIRLLKNWRRVLQIITLGVADKKINISLYYFVDCIIPLMKVSW